MTKRRIIVIGVGASLVILAMAAFINYGHFVLGDIPTMNFIRNSQSYRPEEVAWQEHYDATAPKEGDLAVDFELWDVDGEESVRLSDFRGDKPVALLFGSYT